jgi:RHS repeat-associated protein
MMHSAACSFSAAFRRGDKFTGKERDTESGLDMFGARYYGSSLGRFMTPDWAAAPTDVPYAHFGNPQSLNLYSYVQNNPTTVGDPDGHDGPGSAVAEPEVAEETVGEVLEELAPEAIEAGEGGATLGPVGAAVGVTTVVVVGVGAYEYNKHFSDPGAPPAPPTPKPPATVPSPQMAEHKEARPSTKEDHQQGQTRKKRDARGGEKGDKAREDKGMFPRKRPSDYPKKGPWPPKPPKPPDPPPPPPKKDDGTT